MRGIGSELLSVAEVLAIPLLIAAAFPSGAIRFSASRGLSRTGESPAAIVFLDETAVARVMREARTVSRREERGRAYVDLVSAEFLGAENEPAAVIGSRRPAVRTSSVPVVKSGIPPFLPSRRAAAPVRISAEAEKDEPVFPRNELLKLNY